MKKNLSFVFVFIFFLLIATFLNGQDKITDFVLLTKAVRQYEKAEWDIRLKASFNNPYDQKDISVDMVLTSPSGMPVTLPCYFESGATAASLWKARFSPREAGRYRYSFLVKNKTGAEMSAAVYFTCLPSGKPGFLHAHNLWTFQFDNGQLFRGIGENVAWESRAFENDKWTYDHFLPTLSGNGANFFRTWMCYWNLPLEWQKVGATSRYSNTDQYFNPGAVTRMDELVRLTDSLNLYFMLTLDWHGLLIPGGGWNNSTYNQVNGGPAKTPTDFFTMQTAQEKYKNKLRYIVARWGYSTHIAAIEFFNEIDNAAFSSADSILIPPAAITQWHDEMSRYLKELDPYGHMVTTSVSHRDIVGMNSLAYLDFNQKHIYKHTEKIPAIYPGYIQTYGKPYVVGEFGFRWEDANPKYGDAFDYDFKRGLWYGLFSATPVLPMSWWWELFDTRNMAVYFKSVREISDQMLKAGNGTFKPFPVAVNTVQSFGVKCGNKYFIYLLNDSDSNIQTTVSFEPGSKEADFSLLSFVPATRKYQTITDFKVTNKRFLINNIQLDSKKELVLIVMVR
jgi:hypothetical protein